MKKGKNREINSGKSSAPKARRNFYLPNAVLLIIGGAIMAGAFWLFHGIMGEAQSHPAETKEPDSAAKAGLDRLKGVWQRPDGGYIIEIKAIDPGGKLAAAYFNPRPINVSHAEATQDGQTVKVFLELRDRNYPGATYHLNYDPKSDQLRGVYFQPALQQSFDVFFVRMK
jgi:hypothetical protein